MTQRTPPTGPKTTPSVARTGLSERGVCSWRPKAVEDFPDERKWWEGRQVLVIPVVKEDIWRTLWDPEREPPSSGSYSLDGWQRSRLSGNPTLDTAGDTGK